MRMAAVMRIRVGLFTSKWKQFSIINYCIRDRCIAQFHRSAFLSVMGQDVKMPSLSPTMSEGSIVKWLKKEGDNIVPGDIICEIQTDKAVVAFEMEEEAVLAKILVPENTHNIKVGTLIALTVNQGEDWKNVEVLASATSSAPPESASSSPPSGTSSKSGGGSHSGSGSSSDAKVNPKFHTASHMSYGPAVRYLLEKYGMEASAITPTGNRSKLLKEDVLKYIQSKGLKEKPLKKVPPPTLAKAKSPPLPLKRTKGGVPGSKFVEVEVTNVRKVIANRLSESKSLIPHSYSSIICDISKIMSERTKYKEEGITISVNDYIIKAVGCALQQFPEVNAHYIKDHIKPLKDIDISIAVATEKGLMTPIVFDVPRKGLIDVSESVRDLALRARDGKLQPQEFQGGSFTISNLGMFGVREFSAIINPPQCGILAIGTGQRILNENLNVCTKMHVTLSYDRRAFDEAIAAEFLKGVQSMLQDPAMMIVGASTNLRIKFGQEDAEYE